MSTARRLGVVCIAVSAFIPTFVSSAEHIIAAESEVKNDSAALEIDTLPVQASAESTHVTIQDTMPPPVPSSSVSAVSEGPAAATTAVPKPSMAASAASGKQVGKRINKLAFIGGGAAAAAVLAGVIIGLAAAGGDNGNGKPPPGGIGVNDDIPEIDVTLPQLQGP